MKVNVFCILFCLIEILFPTSFVSLFVLSCGFAFLTLLFLVTTFATICARSSLPHHTVLVVCSLILFCLCHLFKSLFVVPFYILIRDLCLHMYVHTRPFHHFGYIPCKFNTYITLPISASFINKFHRVFSLSLYLHLLFLCPLSLFLSRCA